ncbi:MAG: Rpn family recombination-promoting nuclease/putative transposase [Planctomycetaceae bacterium]|jgi:hypothetical protein|nr:Rpn family recombination-promoting nuclease/putative transposase [Planctomycetaceae bacterium]
MTQPNRNHKDTVFVKLFSERESLLELYGAITGKDCPPDTDIQMATLDGVLFLDQLNDLAFIVDSHLVVLIEHQSTINKNIPLRFLLYVAREYEKIIDNKVIYNSSLVKIPTPVFIVFYNGTADFPDDVTLNLSDAFEDVKGDNGLTDGDKMLELKVRIININKGRNEQFVKRSGKLCGYVDFMARIRYNRVERKMELAEAIPEAVKYCVDNGVIPDFLKKYSSEVINMLMTEFKMEDAIAVWMAEGKVEGRIEGRIEGRRFEAEAIAARLLRRGDSVDEIAELTDLSRADVEILKQQIDDV